MAATYGTYDLRLLYNHHLSVGLGFGIGLILFFTAVMFITHIMETKPPVIVIDRGGTTPGGDVRIPHPYDPLRIPAGTRPPVRPRDGVPVAVADTLAGDRTIPEQNDPARDVGKIDPSTINSGDIAMPGGCGGDEEPNPDTFRVVEVWPTVVHSVTPAYPEIARLSDLEGKVVVKALIGKDGRVRRAFVISSTAEVFNQPSLDAIMEFVFTPAVMGNGPVLVWVSMPFNFRLR